MKTGLLFLLLFFLLCSGFVPGDEVCAENRSAEKYRYEAIPLGGEEGRAEAIDMEITRSGLNLRYKTRRVSPSGLEEVEIDMSEPGRIELASRRFFSAQNDAIATEKIWREHEKAYLRKGMEPEGRVRSFDLPPGKLFAVDGSLLILMRAFPFGSNEAWPVYMVDFSGATVTVTLRRTGIEEITVPMGTFNCYKMEVTVEIPILRPHVIFWVAINEPHFLVKSIGKQGPFTLSYETSLLSMN